MRSAALTAAPPHRTTHPHPCPGATPLLAATADLLMPPVSRQHPPPSLRYHYRNGTANLRWSHQLMTSCSCGPATSVSSPCCRLEQGGGQRRHSPQGFAGRAGGGGTGGGGQQVRPAQQPSSSSQQPSHASATTTCCTALQLLASCMSVHPAKGTPGPWTGCCTTHLGYWCSSSTWEAALGCAASDRFLLPRPPAEQPRGPVSQPQPPR